MSSVRLLNPPTLPPPPGYSQVAVVGDGELIVIAGQVALDAQGNVVGPGDFHAQAIQVFRNLLAALDAVGATSRNLVKLTTFVTDISQLPAFRAARDMFLDPTAPRSSPFVVSASTAGS